MWRRNYWNQEENFLSSSATWTVERIGILLSKIAYGFNLKAIWLRFSSN